MLCFVAVILCSVECRRPPKYLGNIENPDVIYQGQYILCNNKTLKTFSCIELSELLFFLNYLFHYALLRNKFIKTIPLFQKVLLWQTLNFASSFGLGFLRGSLTCLKCCIMLHLELNLKYALPGTFLWAAQDPLLVHTAADNNPYAKGWEKKLFEICKLPSHPK